METTPSRMDWEQRYAVSDTPWDLDQPPPWLTRLIAEEAGDAKRVLVPGAGYGTDAIAWAKGGHEAVALDFSATALAGARDRAERHGVSIQLLEADIFDELPTLAGAFDLIWEQTCFCAIPPERRDDYVEAMAGRLKPGGELWGVFIHHHRPGGPPFDMSPDLVREAFAKRFELQSLRPVEDSVERRRGQEFLVVLRLRS